MRAQPSRTEHPRRRKALELKSGMPVLRITRVTFDHSGVPFEYVESIYRGDKYVFNVSLGL